MAPKKIRQISLPVPSDRPWVLCFMPLSPRRIRRTARVVCYGLVALLPGTTGVLPQHTNSEAALPPESDSTTLVLSTALGEHKQFTLPDGSRVELNSASRLQVNFSPLARRTELEAGEALFQVTHERARPFIVTSGRSVIEDIGTAFDVYKKPHSTLVSVVEGRITLYPRIVAASHSRPNDGWTPDKTSRSNTLRPELHKGQQIELPDDSTGSPHFRSNLSDAELSRLTAWRDGRVEFEYDGEPLAQAVEEFGRYHPARFVFGDNALRKLNISGSFRTGNLDDFLLALRTEFHIQTQKSVGDEGITIITLTSGMPKKAPDHHSKRN
jgi:ferric-dicitrate binding protein FerR (iron transport regulator)